MECFLAHIRRDPTGMEEDVQTVKDHCRKTAQYAGRTMEAAGLAWAGYLAGLVHDAGKYTSQFQAYLRDSEGHRGSVNHTFAGVRLLLERYFTQGSFSGVVCELLALAAGGHHGLFDCVDRDGKNGFQRRLTKADIGYEEATENFLRLCAGEEELDVLFRRACEELTLVLERILSLTDETCKFCNDETAFYSGLLARLLLSAVIEGDRRDTAEFMRDVQFSPVRDAGEMRIIWGTCLDRVEGKLETLPRTSPIDLARRTISEQCRRLADQPGGVVRLNVPTGGGKTLSSLRYALAHAKKFGKRRIIFAAPLLSILEQNTAVVRNYVQDNSLILEHHSNLIRPKEDPDRLDELELLTETWDAPIIITTLVQLLNTLFSGKTSAIRRFHALWGSVIVIDEVQTVPSKMLSLFSLALNFLAEICDATVVLCSATQPCIEQIEHPLHAPIPDLVPYDPAVWRAFRRTRILDAGRKSLVEIAEFARTQLETADSLLIVCNKKAQAQRLYELLTDEELALFSLSAAMCVAHRRDTLDKLRQSLGRKGEKTVCISTQVIEAGVDISFACVIRLCAGMDSVVQSAGRCNRNGEAGPGVLAPVFLVQCQEGSLSRLPDIKLGHDATVELLCEFQRDPEQYAGRLDSDGAIGYYYRALYRREPTGHHDYVWHEGEPSLFSLLSLNRYCTQDQPYYFRQAFRQAGTLFQVFEENTTDVIVPYGEGRELILELCGSRAKWDIPYARSLLEKAKLYTIALYQYQIDCLAAENALLSLPGGAIGLDKHYSEATGFSVDESDLNFLGVT